MSNTPHELADDFPGEVEKIHALKLADAHFAKLVDEYHTVNRAVHGAESTTKPTSETHEAELRHKRLQLKDEIWRMLRAQPSIS